MEDNNMMTWAIVNGIDTYITILFTIMFGGMIFCFWMIDFE